MIAGIRPPVWIASATLGALAVLFTLRAPQPGVPSADASRAAAIDAASEHPAASDRAPDPAAVVLASPATPRAPAAPQGLARAASGDAAPFASTPAPRAAAGDSRLAADLRILEEDAARIAEACGLVDAAALDASLRRVAPAPGTAREDARRTLLADAVLVDHWIDDAYRGTEFPIGYPAEERTRAAAVSQVGALSAEQRRDLLDVVLQLQADATEPLTPQFAPLESGLVWEGAIR